MCRQEIIDSFMDYMDFNKIHNTMKALNWSWVGTNGVPEVWEIRQCFRQLFNEFIDRRLSAIQSGGFHIWREGGIIKAAFEVESWEVDLTEE